MRIKSFRVELGRDQAADEMSDLILSALAHSPNSDPEAFSKLLLQITELKDSFYSRLLQPTTDALSLIFEVIKVLKKSLLCKGRARILQQLDDLISEFNNPSLNFDEIFRTIQALPSDGISCFPNTAKRILLYLTNCIQNKISPNVLDIRDLLSNGYEQDRKGLLAEDLNRSPLTVIKGDIRKTISTQTDTSLPLQTRLDSYLDALSAEGKVTDAQRRFVNYYLITQDLIKLTPINLSDFAHYSSSLKMYLMDKKSDQDFGISYSFNFEFDPINLTLKKAIALISYGLNSTSEKENHPLGIHVTYEIDLSEIELIDPLTTSRGLFKNFSVQIRFDSSSSACIEIPDEIGRKLQPIFVEGSLQALPENYLSPIDALFDVDSISTVYKKVDGTFSIEPICSDPKENLLIADGYKPAFEEIFGLIKESLIKALEEQKNNRSKQVFFSKTEKTFYCTESILAENDVALTQFLEKYLFAASFWQPNIILTPSLLELLLEYFPLPSAEIVCFKELPPELKQKYGLFLLYQHLSIAHFAFFLNRNEQVLFADLPEIYLYFRETKPTPITSAIVESNFLKLFNALKVEGLCESSNREKILKLIKKADLSSIPNGFNNLINTLAECISGDEAETELFFDLLSSLSRKLILANIDQDTSENYVEKLIDTLVNAYKKSISQKYKNIIGDQLITVLTAKPEMLAYTLFQLGSNVEFLLNKRKIAKAYVSRFDNIVYSEKDAHFINVFIPFVRKNKLFNSDEYKTLFLKRPALQAKAIIAFSSSTENPEYKHLQVDDEFLSHITTPAPGEAVPYDILFSFLENLRGDNEKQTIIVNHILKQVDFNSWMNNHLESTIPRLLQLRINKKGRLDYLIEKIVVSQEAFLACCISNNRDLADLFYLYEKKKIDLNGLITATNILLGQNRFSERMLTKSASSNNLISDYFEYISNLPTTEEREALIKTFDLDLLNHLMLYSEKDSYKDILYYLAILIQYNREEAFDLFKKTVRSTDDLISLYEEQKITLGTLVKLIILQSGHSEKILQLGKQIMKSLDEFFELYKEKAITLDNLTEFTTSFLAKDPSAIFDYFNQVKNLPSYEEKDRLAQAFDIEILSEYIKSSNNIARQQTLDCLLFLCQHNRQGAISLLARTIKEHINTEFLLSYPYERLILTLLRKELDQTSNPNVQDLLKTALDKFLLVKILSRVDTGQTFGRCLDRNSVHLFARNNEDKAELLSILKFEKLENSFLQKMLPSINIEELRNAVIDDMKAFIPLMKKSADLMSMKTYYGKTYNYVMEILKANLYKWFTLEGDLTPELKTHVNPNLPLPQQPYPLLNAFGVCFPGYFPEYFSEYIAKEVEVTLKEVYKDENFEEKQKNNDSNSLGQPPSAPPSYQVDPHHYKSTAEGRILAVTQAVTGRSEFNSQVRTAITEGYFELFKNLLLSQIALLDNPALKNQALNKISCLLHTKYYKMLISASPRASEYIDSLISDVKGILSGYVSSTEVIDDLLFLDGLLCLEDSATETKENSPFNNPFLNKEEKSILNLISALRLAHINNRIIEEDDDFYLATDQGIQQERKIFELALSAFDNPSISEPIKKLLADTLKDKLAFFALVMLEAAQPEEMIVLKNGLPFFAQKTDFDTKGILTSEVLSDTVKNALQVVKAIMIDDSELNVQCKALIRITSILKKNLRLDELKIILTSLDTKICNEVLPNLISGRKDNEGNAYILIRELNASLAKTLSKQEDGLGILLDILKDNATAPSLKPFLLQRYLLILELKYQANLSFDFIEQISRINNLKNISPLPRKVITLLNILGVETTANIAEESDMDLAKTVAKSVSPSPAELLIVRKEALVGKIANSKLQDLVPLFELLTEAPETLEEILKNIDGKKIAKLQTIKLEIDDLAKEDSKYSALTEKLTKRIADILASDSDMVMLRAMFSALRQAEENKKFSLLEQCQVALDKAIEKASPGLIPLLTDFFSQEEYFKLALDSLMKIIPHKMFLFDLDSCSLLLEQLVSERFKTFIDTFPETHGLIKTFAEHLAKRYSSEPHKLAEKIENTSSLEQAIYFHLYIKALQLEFLNTPNKDELIKAELLKLGPLSSISPLTKNVIKYLNSLGITELTSEIAYDGSRIADICPFLFQIQVAPTQGKLIAPEPRALQNPEGIWDYFKQVSLLAAFGEDFKKDLKKALTDDWTLVLKESPDLINTPFIGNFYTKLLAIVEGTFFKLREHLQALSPSENISTQPEATACAFISKLVNEMKREIGFDETTPENRQKVERIFIATSLLIRQERMEVSAEVKRAIAKSHFNAFMISLNQAIQFESTKILSCLLETRYCITFRNSEYFTRAKEAIENILISIEPGKLTEAESFDKILDTQTVVFDGVVKKLPLPPIVPHAVSISKKRELALSFSSAVCTLDPFLTDREVKLYDLHQLIDSCDCESRLLLTSDKTRYYKRPYDTPEGKVSQDEKTIEAIRVFLDEQEFLSEHSTQHLLSLLKEGKKNREDRDKPLAEIIRPYFLQLAYTDSDSFFSVFYGKTSEIFRRGTQAVMLLSGKKQDAANAEFRSHFASVYEKLPAHLKNKIHFKLKNLYASENFHDLIINGIDRHDISDKAEQTKREALLLRDIVPQANETSDLVFGNTNYFDITLQSPPLSIKSKNTIFNVVEKALSKNINTRDYFHTSLETSFQWNFSIAFMRYTSLKPGYTVTFDPSTGFSETVENSRDVLDCINTGCIKEVLVAKPTNLETFTYFILKHNEPEKALSLLKEASSSLIPMFLAENNLNIKKAEAWFKAISYGSEEHENFLRSSLELLTPVRKKLQEFIARKYSEQGNYSALEDRIKTKLAKQTLEGIERLELALDFQRYIKALQLTFIAEKDTQAISAKIASFGNNISKIPLPESLAKYLISIGFEINNSQITKEDSLLASAAPYFIQKPVEFSINNLNNLVAFPNTSNNSDLFQAFAKVDKENLIKLFPEINELIERLQEDAEEFEKAFSKKTEAANSGAEFSKEEFMRSQPLYFGKGYKKILEIIEAYFSHFTGLDGLSNQELKALFKEKFERDFTDLQLLSFYSGLIHYWSGMATASNASVLSHIAKSMKFTAKEGLNADARQAIAKSYFNAFIKLVHQFLQESNKPTNTEAKAKLAYLVHSTYGNALYHYSPRAVAILETILGERPERPIASLSSEFKELDFFEKAMSQFPQDEYEKRIAIDPFVSESEKEVWHFLKAIKALDYSNRITRYKETPYYSTSLAPNAEYIKVHETIQGFLADSSIRKELQDELRNALMQKREQLAVAMLFEINANQHINLNNYSETPYPAIVNGYDEPPFKSNELATILAKHINNAIDLLTYLHSLEPTGLLLENHRHKAYLVNLITETLQALSENNKVESLKSLFDLSAKILLPDNSKKFKLASSILITKLLPAHLDAVISLIDQLARSAKPEVVSNLIITVVNTLKSCDRTAINVEHLQLLMLNLSTLLANNNILKENVYKEKHSFKKAASELGEIITGHYEKNKRIEDYQSHSLKDIISFENFIRALQCTYPNRPEIIADKIKNALGDFNHLLYFAPISSHTASFLQWLKIPYTGKILDADDVISFASPTISTHLTPLALDSTIVRVDIEKSLGINGSLPPEKDPLTGTNTEKFALGNTDEGLQERFVIKQSHENQPGKQYCRYSKKIFLENALQLIESIEESLAKKVADVHKRKIILQLLEKAHAIYKEKINALPEWKTDKEFETNVKRFHEIRNAFVSAIARISANYIELSKHRPKDLEETLLAQLREAEQDYIVRHMSNTNIMAEVDVKGVHLLSTQTAVANLTEEQQAIVKQKAESKTFAKQVRYHYRKENGEIIPDTQQAHSSHVRDVEGLGNAFRSRVYTSDNSGDYHLKFAGLRHSVYAPIEVEDKIIRQMMGLRNAKQILETLLQDKYENDANFRNLIEEGFALDFTFATQNILTPMFDFIGDMRRNKLVKPLARRLAQVKAQTEGITSQRAINKLINSFEKALLKEVSGEDESAQLHEISLALKTICGPHSVKIENGKIKLVDRKDPAATPIRVKTNHSNSLVNFIGQVRASFKGQAKTFYCQGLSEFYGITTEFILNQLQRPQFIENKTGEERTILLDKASKLAEKIQSKRAQVQAALEANKEKVENKMQALIERVGDLFKQPGFPFKGPVKPTAPFINPANIFEQNYDSIHYLYEALESVGLAYEKIRIEIDKIENPENADPSLMSLLDEMKNKKALLKSTYSKIENEIKESRYYFLDYYEDAYKVIKDEVRNTFGFPGSLAEVFANDINAAPSVLRNIMACHGYTLADLAEIFTKHQQAHFDRQKQDDNYTAPAHFMFAHFMMGNEIEAGCKSSEDRTSTLFDRVEALVVAHELKATDPNLNIDRNEMEKIITTVHRQSSGDIITAINDVRGKQVESGAAGEFLATSKLDKSIAAIFPKYPEKLKKFYRPRGLLGRFKKDMPDLPELQVVLLQSALFRVIEYTKGLEINSHERISLSQHIEKLLNKEVIDASEILQALKTIRQTIRNAARGDAKEVLAALDAQTKFDIRKNNKAIVFDASKTNDNTFMAIDALCNARSQIRSYRDELKAIKHFEKDLKDILLAIKATSSLFILKNLGVFQQILSTLRTNLDDINKAEKEKTRILGSEAKEIYTSLESNIAAVENRLEKIEKRYSTHAATPNGLIIQGPSMATQPPVANKIDTMGILSEGTKFYLAPEEIENDAQVTTKAKNKAFYEYKKEESKLEYLPSHQEKVVKAQHIRHTGRYSEQDMQMVRAMVEHTHALEWKSVSLAGEKRLMIFAYLHFKAYDEAKNALEGSNEKMQFTFGNTYTKISQIEKDASRYDSLYAQLKKHYSESLGLVHEFSKKPDESKTAMPHGNQTTGSSLFKKLQEDAKQIKKGPSTYTGS